VAARES
jgi:hypothetical protein